MRLSPSLLVVAPLVASPGAAQLRVPPAFPPAAPALAPSGAPARAQAPAASPARVVGAAAAVACFAFVAVSLSPLG
jgi:hypothetical protein